MTDYDGPERYWRKARRLGRWATGLAVAALLFGVLSVVLKVLSLVSSG